MTQAKKTRQERDSEQSEQTGVDFVGDGGEVFGVVLEVEAVGVDGQDFAFVKSPSRFISCL